jgi:menaquinone-specific isochorismate synthase
VPASALAAGADAPQASPLVVRTVAVDDPGPLLDLVPPDGLAWVRRGDGMVGWGSVARWEFTGPTRFADAAACWRKAVRGAVVRDDVGLAGTGPLAFGSFSFADAGTSVLLVPEVVVGRRDGRAWVTTTSAGGRVPPAVQPRRRGPARGPGPVTFTPGSLGPQAWSAAVARAVDLIDAGALEKVVLARDVVARTERAVDPRWPLGRLAGTYPHCWTFHVDGMLGATPEMLLRLERGLATSRVLAGTIQRTGDDTADLALAASLARSSKDLEEHELAVRSVADALARHCSSTNVPEVPFVLHLPNVMHLATDVAGVLSDGRSALELVAELHPSAAVCGTPTRTATAVIGELEHMDRGRYAGPIGWVDAAGDGEWALALRCAELDPADPTRLRLFAGCGIVAGSDPADELAESEAKLTPMRDALAQARRPST